MQPSTTVHLLNALSIVTTVPLLCVTFSIFDFIVTHRMYYTIPDQRVLLDPELFWWFIAGTTLVLILSSLATFYDFIPSSVRHLSLRYPILLSLAHGALLCFNCILCAFCAYLAGLASNAIGRYAYNATPEQFRMASHWYFIRLRIVMTLFGAEAVFSFFVLCKLYFGVQCRYQSLAEFPQQSKKNVATQLFV